MKRITLNKLFCLTLFANLLCICTTSAQPFSLSTTPNDYFTLTSGMRRTTFRIRLTGNNDAVDSQRLNFEIRRLSGQGGGTIEILAENVDNDTFIIDRKNIYLANINMLNNIRIRIQSNIRIITRLLPGFRNNIFMFGNGSATALRNVSVEGMGGRFAVNIRANNSTTQATLARFGNVTNFRLRNVIINDANTLFASLFFSFEGGERNFDRVPRNGFINNVRQTSARAGFGIMQMVAGRDILFTNLNGTGGVSLRIESDGRIVSSDSSMTINNIAARNVRVSNGQAAVLLSPHRVNQGLVEVGGVRADASAFGVVLAPGFRGVNVEATGTAVANSGSFNSNSIIRNITVNPQATGAQVTGRMIAFFRCNGRQGNLLNTPISPDGESRIFRSVGAIDNRANSACETNITDSRGNPTQGAPLMCYSVRVQNITFNNRSRAEHQKNFIGFRELLRACPSSSKNLNIIVNNNDSISIDDVQTASVYIFNTIGQMVKHIPSYNISEDNQIDISDLSTGIYFVKINEGETVTNKKLIKQ